MVTAVTDETPYTLNIQTYHIFIKKCQVNICEKIYNILIFYQKQYQYYEQNCPIVISR